MNEYALYHQSESNYCFPLDDHKVLLRFRTQKNDEDIVSIHVLYNMSAYFSKNVLKAKMEVAKHDRLFDYYETIVCCEIPSYFYLFEIECKNNQKYYYCQYGIDKKYDFSLAGFTAFRVPFVNEKNIVKVNPKFKGDVFYQIFPERFKMGDHQKDKSYINRDWNSKDLQFDIKDGKLHSTFIGGDLQGIIDELDYIKELGIDTVYLTPINISNSNHKYNVDDYFKIDPHFGDEKTFKTLVDLAHQKGMKIMMDLVFNHTSNTHPFFLSVLKDGKNSPYYNFYNMFDSPLKTDGLNYYSFNSGKYMPKTNSNNPDVQNYFINVGEYYLKNFRVDGFRLDVANEVCHEFWIRFKIHMKEIDPNVLIIGENWDEAHEYLKPYEFDGIMNYGFFVGNWCYFVFKRFNTSQYVNFLNWLLVRYKDNNNYMMLNLLDSHDTPRFYHYLKGNKDAYLLGLLMLIGYIGYPMIYYGDEIFMLGGGDPDNRKGMEWDSAMFDSPYHQMFKDIVALRKISTFKDGKIKIDEKNDMVYLYRYDKNDNYLIIINNNDVKKDVKEQGKILISNHYENNVLDRYGFVVLKI